MQQRSCCSKWSHLLRMWKISPSQLLPASGSNTDFWKRPWTEIQVHSMSHCCRYVSWKHNLTRTLVIPWSLSCVFFVSELGISLAAFNDLFSEGKTLCDAHAVRASEMLKAQFGDVIDGLHSPLRVLRGEKIHETNFYSPRVRTQHYVQIMHTGDSNHWVTVIFEKGMNQLRFTFHISCTLTVWYSPHWSWFSFYLYRLYHSYYPWFSEANETAGAC